MRNILSRKFRLCSSNAENVSRYSLFLKSCKWRRRHV